MVSGITVNTSRWYKLIYATDNINDAAQQNDKQNQRFLIAALEVAWKG